MSGIQVSVRNLSLIDVEAAGAYNRLSKLLVVDTSDIVEAVSVDQFEEDYTTDAVSNVAILVQKIFVLERENKILKFMSGHPAFDPSLHFATFQENIERNLASGKVAVFDLHKTYNFEFFKVMDHPEYVYQVCCYLNDICIRANTPPAQIWQDLIATCGLLSDDYIASYEDKLDEIENSKF